MAYKKISGVYAAVLTPRLADESVNVPALRKLIAFLMEQGISSYAVNGATGEFCLTTPAQLRMMLATVKEASRGKAKILCGAGAAGTPRRGLRLSNRTPRSGRAAASSGHWSQTEGYVQPHRKGDRIGARLRSETARSAGVAGQGSGMVHNLAPT